jgi:hypothetical protein
MDTPINNICFAVILQIWNGVSVFVILYASNVCIAAVVVSLLQIDFDKKFSLLSALYRDLFVRGSKSV